MLKPRIGVLRRAARLTQEELARAVGASASAVGSWETGERTPRRDAMWRLASFLGVSVDDLYENSELVDLAAYLGTTADDLLIDTPQSTAGPAAAGDSARNARTRRTREASA